MGEEIDRSDGPPFRGPSDRIISHPKGSGKCNDPPEHRPRHQHPGTGSLTQNITVGLLVLTGVNTCSGLTPAKLGLEHALHRGTLEVAASNTVSVLTSPSGTTPRAGTLPWPSYALPAIASISAAAPPARPPAPNRLGHGQCHQPLHRCRGRQGRPLNIAGTLTTTLGTDSTVILENAMAAVKSVVPIPAEILRPERSGHRRHRYVPGGSALPSAVRSTVRAT